MSTSGLSEMTADLSKDTATATAQPTATNSKFRLSKPNQSKSLVYRYQNPLLQKQFSECGWLYELSMEDQTLTTFHQLAVPSTITTKVNAMFRIIARDVLGDNKKKEYLYYMCTKSGKDKKGRAVTELFQTIGIDFNCNVTQEMDEDESPLPPKKVGAPFEVYVIPFSKEAVEKVLEDTDQELDDIQFSVKADRLYGGYSYDEFVSLDMTELLERGKLSRAGSPIDFLYTSMSPKERMFLQVGAVRTDF